MQNWLKILITFCILFTLGSQSILLFLRKEDITQEDFIPTDFGAPTTSIDEIPVYESIDGIQTLTATASATPDNVTLYYAYSPNNISWAGGDYWTVIKDLDPKFRWILDGDTTDEEGLIDGTATAPPAYIATIIPAPGNITQCGNFTSPDEILVADSPFINTGTGYLGQQRSFSFWFNADTVASGNGNIIWGQGGGTNSISIYTYDDGGTPYIYASAVESANKDFVRAQITTGTTYHVGITFDFPNNNISMYLNGEFIESDTTMAVGTSLASHSGNNALGGQDSNTDNHLGVSISAHHDGTIADFCYWSDGSVLSATNISDIFTSGNSTNVWNEWVNASNPDTSTPWSWDFNYPNGEGYYKFASLGKKDGEDDEALPDEDSPDAISHFSLSSSVNQSTYEQTSSISLGTTSGQGYDNTSLYYRWSETNNTFTPTVVSGAGIFTGTTIEGGETNLNKDTDIHKLEYSSAEYDSTYFSFSGSEDEYIDINIAGDYLLSYTIPLLRATSGSTRVSTISTIYINDTKLDIGRSASTYIRGDSGHQESSGHFNVLLEDVGLNDRINVRIEAGTTVYDTVTADEKFTVFLQYIGPSETIFTASGTQTTAGTDMAPAVATGIKWVEITEDTGYTHDDVTNPDRITLDDAGTYLIHINIPLGGAVTRGASIGRVNLNGVQVGQFAQGYIRNSNGHTDSSIHWSGIVTTTSASEYINVTVQTDTGDETLTTDSEQCSIYIQKIPTTSLIKLNGTQVGGADEWNPATRSTIDWTNQENIDTNYFFHAAGNDNITIREAGTYILIANVALTYDSTSYRPNPKMTVELDGTIVEGAESKTGYIRDNSEHNYASDLLVYPISTTSANQDITIHMEREGATVTPVNDVIPAKFIMYKIATTNINSCPWTLWDDASNPDTAYPHEWSFDWPNSTGYYEFYSVAKHSGDTESAPSVADAIYHYTATSGDWTQEKFGYFNFNNNQNFSQHNLGHFVFDNNQNFTQSSLGYFIFTGNSAPVQFNEIPTNESIGISISTTVLSINLTDIDSDTLNWSIETSPDIGSSSATGQMLYQEDATDYNVGIHTNTVDGNWSTFNNIGDDVLYFNYTKPMGSTGVVWYIDCPGGGITHYYYNFSIPDNSFNYYENKIWVRIIGNGNSGYFTAYHYDGSWNSFGGVGDSYIAEEAMKWSYNESISTICNVSGLEPNTRYTWYVNVTDGYEIINKIYHFTTEAWWKQNKLGHFTFQNNLNFTQSDFGYFVFSNNLNFTQQSHGWFTLNNAKNHTQRSLGFFGFTNNLNFSSLRIGYFGFKNDLNFTQNNLGYFGFNNNLNFTQTDFGWFGFTNYLNYTQNTMGHFTFSNNQNFTQDTLGWFSFMNSLPPVLSNPDPYDGKSGLLSISNWSVDMTDPEGDNMSWTIETSPDIGSAGTYTMQVENAYNSTGATGGTFPGYMINGNWNSATRSPGTDWFNYTIPSGTTSAIWRSKIKDNNGDIYTDITIDPIPSGECLWLKSIVTTSEDAIELFYWDGNSWIDTTVSDNCDVTAWFYEEAVQWTFDGASCQLNANSYNPIYTGYTDNDWDTFYQTEEEWVYINYTKPIGATGGIYKLKLGMLNNYTIPKEVWDYNDTMIRIRIYDVEEDGGDIYWLTSSGWLNAGLGNDQYFHEEEMYWLYNTTNGTKTCSVNSSTLGTYTVYVNVTDGENWTNETFTFTINNYIQNKLGFFTFNNNQNYSQNTLGWFKFGNSKKFEQEKLGHFTFSNDLNYTTEKQGFFVFNNNLNFSQNKIGFFTFQSNLNYTQDTMGFFKFSNTLNYTQSKLGHFVFNNYQNFTQSKVGYFTFNNNLNYSQDKLGFFTFKNSLNYTQNNLGYFTFSNNLNFTKNNLGWFTIENNLNYTKQTLGWFKFGSNMNFTQKTFGHFTFGNNFNHTDNSVGYFTFKNNMNYSSESFGYFDFESHTNFTFAQNSLGYFTFKNNLNFTPTIGYFRFSVNLNYTQNQIGYFTFNNNSTVGLIVNYTTSVVGESITFIPSTTGTITQYMWNVSKHSGIYMGSTGWQNASVPSLFSYTFSDTDSVTVTLFCKNSTGMASYTTTVHSLYTPSKPDYIDDEYIPDISIPGDVQGQEAKDIQWYEDVGIQQISFVVALTAIVILLTQKKRLRFKTKKQHTVKYYEGKKDE